MKALSKIAVTSLLLAISQMAYAEDASSENAKTENAREIMRKLIDRDDGESQFSRDMVATCQYSLANGKLRCVEKPRIKAVDAVRKDYGATGKDTKSIMIINKPAADAGIGFLQFDYEAQDKESDQWMYLSALGKVKRIVSGSDNEPKKGSLFGSEFSYEDIEKRHLDDYEYKIIKEETFKGRDCWVIESLPTPAHARKSNYSRTEIWVDKERYVLYKTNLYDRGGQLYKQLSMSDYVQMDGVWVARKMNMNNVRDRRISTLKSSDIRLNIPVEDSLMTQRTLTDGAFREQQLKAIRVVAK